MTDFFIKNSFSIFTLIGSVLLTWGYLRWAIPDALQRLKEVEKEVKGMKDSLVAIDRTLAVQVEKNGNHDRIHQELLDWMKTLDTKLDTFIQRATKTN